MGIYTSLGGCTSVGDVCLGGMTCLVMEMLGVTVSCGSKSLL